MRRIFFRYVVLVGSVILLAACDKPANFNSTDITGAAYGKSLRLTDQFGKQRSLADFSGKVVAVFFGYTQCPDVCPTTLAMLANVIKRLGSDGQKLQVVFVTVDPERDTSELLKQYMSAFNPTFVGLRGTPAQTAAVAKEFNVFYEKRGDVAKGNYTIDHTAGTYLFDPKGQVRLFVRNGETPEHLIPDIQLLLAGK
ncbi:MAG TPA: SCO family protein [Rhodocyclaceae bacterium]|nr:SCO family protein [Rhodocyclaceae bacterium]